MSNKPVLFFSKKCNNCQTLWAKLQQENRLNDFIKICIEDNPSKIPPMITSVPSLYIKGRAPITGMAINLFLNSPNASTQPPTQESFKNPPKNQSNNAPNQPPPIVTSTNGLNNISDFNPIEMGNSWSDSYSFIQDNPSPMAFCYEFLNNNQANGQQSQQQNQASNNNANNMKLQRTNDFNKRLEELQASRNNI